MFDPRTMPYPWPYPPYPPPERREARVEDRIPARVLAAMTYLRQLTDKTAPDVAANDVGFQEIEGQRLEVEERETLAAASKCLTAYFRGDLRLTAEEKAAAPDDALTAVIKCPNCNGARKGKLVCPLCKGIGHLMTKPCDPDILGVEEKT